MSQLKMLLNCLMPMLIVLAMLCVDTAHCHTVQGCLNVCTYMTLGGSNNFNFACLNDCVPPVVLPCIKKCEDAKVTCFRDQNTFAVTCNNAAFYCAAGCQQA